jgi:hypothetical protein
MVLMERDEPSPRAEGHWSHLDRQRRLGEETLRLIRKAAEHVKADEDRRQLLARQHERAAQKATERLEHANQRVLHLETQLELAERRAASAEEWLQRTHEALKQNLAEPISESDERIGTAAGPRTNVRIVSVERVG